MSLRPNLQNVQNREALDRFDPDYADSDTEFPRLAALIASLAVNVVLTALLLRSCLQKSRSFSNGALPCLAMPCHALSLACSRLRVIVIPFWRSLKLDQIWRILASGYLAMAWASRHGRAGIGSCWCFGTAQRMAVAILIVSYYTPCIRLHCWEKKGVDVVWWRRELYGAVVDLGKRWKPVHVFRFCLGAFLIKDYRSETACTDVHGITCEGVAAFFWCQWTVQCPQYFASSWNHGTRVKMLRFEAWSIAILLFYYHLFSHNLTIPKAC